MAASKDSIKASRSSLASRFKETMRINYRLVPLKFLMLFTYGGMAALHPFLTVHMKSVGLTLTESAFIYALLPFVTCIGPPIGGAIADRIGNYKAVMVGVDVLSIIFHVLMLVGVPSAVPPALPAVQHSLTHLIASLSCADSVSTFTLPSSLGNCSQMNGIVSPIDTLFLDECSSNCTLLSDFAPLICTDTSPRYGIDHCLPLNTSAQVRNVSLSAVNGTVQMNSFMSWEQVMATKLHCFLQLRKSNEHCEVSCRLRGNITVSCAEMLLPVDSNRRMMTVVLYATFRLISNVFIATLISILDAAAYQMSEEYGGDLGFQRMFSLFGMCLAPPVSGFLVGLASQKSGGADYSPAFYIFAGLHGTATLITLFSPISLRTGAESIWHNVGKIIRRPKVSVFVVMMFFGGAAWGFLENFLFWFMEDMGSPKWLLGLTNTTSALSAIPVLAVSTLLMRHFGHIKILTFCFFVYGIRFLAYSAIYDPFLVLPVEVLEAFTTSLFAVTSSVYGGKIAAEYLATIQGLVGSAHNAIGRGVGSLIGGVMFEKLKPRATYRIFGTTYIVLAIIYLILHYTWLRNIKDPKDSKEDTNGDTGYPIAEIERLHGITPVDKEQTARADEAALTRFALMGALTRRYSQAPVLMDNYESRRQSASAGSRRGSTLMPTINYLSHRPSAHL